MTERKSAIVLNQRAEAPIRVCHLAPLFATSTAIEGLHRRHDRFVERAPEGPARPRSRRPSGPHLEGSDRTFWSSARQARSLVKCRWQFCRLIPEKMHDVVEFEKPERPEALLWAVLARLDQLAAPQ